MSSVSQPKISVIIPLYNTEMYIAEAIETISVQSFQDIEIIIVNDGSTDNSLQVVTDLATNNEKIRVFSKKNEGPSESRNLGLEKARGEYIYFMDSDDLLDKDALASCYARCESQQLDFVFFDATAFKEDRSVIVNDYYLRDKILDADKIYTGEEVLNILMGTNLYRPSVWLCFIKRAYLDKINLRFYPGIIHEDELFAAILHMNTQRTGYIPHPYFNRRVRPSSITSSKFTLWNIDCYLIVISELEKYAEKKDKALKDMTKKICSYILNPAIYRASNFTFSDRLKVFKLCLKKGFLKYISLKNKSILLFPFLIKLKSLTK